MVFGWFWLTVIIAIQFNKVMKDVGIALIYVAFFSLIGFSLWVTKSVWVLLALIFTPEYHSKKD